MAFKSENILPFPVFFLMTNIGESKDWSIQSVEHLAAPEPASAVPVIFLISKATVPCTGLSCNKGRALHPRKGGRERGTSGHMWEEFLDWAEVERPTHSKCSWHRSMGWGPG